MNYEEYLRFYIDLAIGTHIDTDFDILRHIHTHISMHIHIGMFMQICVPHIVG